VERIARFIRETNGAAVALTGPDPHYLREVALELPKEVEGFPPRPSDIVVVDPEGEDIGIDEIREVESFFDFSPEYGERKFVVLLDADRMTQQAANAFLKTLEEPPRYGVIIVTTSRWYYLLPTIRSRMVRFSVVPPPLEGDHHPWVRAAAEHDWRVRGELPKADRILKKARKAKAEELVKMVKGSSAIESSLAAFEILERFTELDDSSFIDFVESIGSKLSGKEFFKFNAFLSRVALWLMEIEERWSMEDARFFDSVARAKVANYNNLLTLYNIAIRVREMRREKPWN